jgi:hypothetical protein
MSSYNYVIEIENKKIFIVEKDSLKIRDTSWEIKQIFDENPNDFRNILKIFSDSKERTKKWVIQKYPELIL